MPSSFRVDAPFKPAGDQPEAIKALVDGVRSGLTQQVLAGVTGSGKTNVMAWAVEELQRGADRADPRRCRIGRRHDRAPHLVLEARRLPVRHECRARILHPSRDRQRVGHRGARHCHTGERCPLEEDAPAQQPISRSALGERIQAVWFSVLAFPAHDPVSFRCIVFLTLHACRSA